MTPLHDSPEAPTIPPAEAVFHPALEEGPSGPLLPLDGERTDRLRLALVLQAAGLLAHLEHAGWCLEADWEGAATDEEGRLRGLRARPGRAVEPPQVLLARLLRRVFGTGGALTGRGEARRAGRTLLEAWNHDLAPIHPDRMVAEVLRAAPFLWKPAYGAARRGLIAELCRAGGREVRVAGPGRWRSRLLALGGGRGAVADLVAGKVGRELWEAVEAGRPAARNLPEQGGGAPREPLAAAEALVRRGRFERALDELQGVPFERCGLLRLGCHYLLGQLGSARALLRRLSAVTLTRREVVAVAEIAQRVLTATGDANGAKRWVDRALAAGREHDDPVRLRAEVLAAAAAWDRGEPKVMEDHLEAARAAREVSEVAWRWHHAAALRVLDTDGGEAARHLALALGSHRRRLHRFEAAALWNDLGLARAHGGDLAGAERAFLHALRLQEGCDGPRRLTLALENLAEIRLRRGRITGVREILERVLAANRRSGNHRALTYDTALWVRLELALGHPRAALDLCRDRLAELERGGKARHRPQLQVLAARALGWLGRAAEAAAALAEAGATVRGELEPEEIAPLWALAGEREAALREVLGDLAGTPTAALWRSLLTARPVAPRAWDALEQLEPFRAARLVFDCDLLSPGCVPAGHLRRAVAVFRQLGAGLLAERLEARDAGPWGAVAAYLGKPAADETLGELFLQAGYREIRLWWEAAEDSRVIVDGPGGKEALSAPAAEGTLVLSAPVLDPALRALFRLALRDWKPRRSAAPRPAAGGMVGESAALRDALLRLDRFAASDLPVLVSGESGTGKELAARHLHRRSRRAEAPFLPVNCAALSETLLLSELFGHVRGSFTGADRDRAGVFETAHGGTVFLDEIGDLPLVAQGMLLRVLQEGEVRRVGESLPRRVDVRIVAATHRDLASMVRRGTFREDLFYRLRGAGVVLPPLRERGRDVLLLAEHILDRLAREGRGRREGEASGPPRLSDAARAALLGHAWPGNVRELENVLGTATALAAGDDIESEHLDLTPGSRRPASGDGEGEASGSSYHSQVDALRRRLVSEALTASGGNRAEAARRLGLTRQALSYLVRQLQVEI